MEKCKIIYENMNIEFEKKNIKNIFLKWNIKYYFSDLNY